jgi:aminopeptidase S
MKLQWPRHRRHLVVAAALGLVVLLAALVLASVRAEQSGAPAQAATVYEHLEEFQAIADDHGDRATGTDGYEAAAQYVESQLESAGYESTRQYFTFDSGGESYESFNIIAETAGGSDDNVIMLGAHLDGVPNSPAINDNASGAAALLEAAQELSQRSEPNNKVRFAWWGAEEFPEAFGSRYYVEDLAEHDSGELEHIAAYLNIDMVASPNYVIAVYDARESDDDSWWDVPDGSVEIMEFFTDYFDSQDQPWVPTDWEFYSDQVAFIEEDIPVGGLFTGSNERKSVREDFLFGGAAGQPRDPNYHKPGDDLGNVDLEALSIMTDVITYAATSLAEDSSALE